MKKKQRSTAKRINRKKTKCFNRKAVASNATKFEKVLKFFGNILIKIVFDKIFGKAIVDLLSWVWSWII